MGQKLGLAVRYDLEVANGTDRGRELLCLAIGNRDGKKTEFPL
jgi:hypothetical protein